MMWPVLTKVQYEKLPVIFSSKQIWTHIGVSIFLNWIVAPLIMLGVGMCLSFFPFIHMNNYGLNVILAWATLPEASLERERKGVLLVGIARCIGLTWRFCFPRFSLISYLLFFSHGSCASCSRLINYNVLLSHDLSAGLEYDRLW